MEKQRQLKALQEREDTINKLLEPVKKQEVNNTATASGEQSGEAKKNKKKKNKKGKKEDKPSTEEIQRVQEQQLKDLMENFSLK